MDLDALGTCHESEHIVAEHWVAATCHSVVNSLDVLGVNDEDVVVAFLLYQFLRFLRFDLGRLWLGTLLVFDDPLLDVSNI